MVDARASTYGGQWKEYFQSLQGSFIIRRLEEIVFQIANSETILTVDCLLMSVFEEEKWWNSSVVRAIQ